MRLIERFLLALLELGLRLLVLLASLAVVVWAFGEMTTALVPSAG